MSKLTEDINFGKKPSLNSRPAPAKRKTIFDDSDEDGDKPDGPESLSAPGGLQKPSKPKSNASNNFSSKPPLKVNQTPARISSSHVDLSAKRTAALHTKEAQSLDPSIYDYDGVYDSLHAKPNPSNSNSVSADGTTASSKPKYMTSILAAAEVRKRDQVRAKEKMLAREREAEGDAFADKESFVTGAYKRQQAEMRAAEEEEARKEAEAEKRRKEQGGGMKLLYKEILERDEERHQGVMKAVEESKKDGEIAEEGPRADKNEKKESEVDGKTEADLAKERGAMVNEDGEVVDKRELLSAGLNAAGGATRAKPRPRNKPPPPGSNVRGIGDRDQESRAFEDQLLGKHGASSDEDDEGVGGRAAKSRKLEDALLAGFDSD